MKAIVSPSRINGTITVPSSKSLTHRAIICAALSNGTSVLTNCNICDDTLATIYSMRELGAKIDVIGPKVIVTGMKLEYKEREVHLNALSSASTLRFLLPIATQFNKEVVFNVNRDLIKRPLTIYEELYSKVGEVKKVKSPKINRIFAHGSIEQKVYKLSGESSQYISGLLFMLPLMNHNSKIIVEGKINSKSYIDLTIEVMNKFGVKVREVENTYFVRGNQKYKNKNYSVEGDWSTGAFFIALGAIGEKVTVNGLNLKSSQKDKDILAIMKKMGAKIDIENKKITSYKSNLIGRDLDLSDNVDLALPFAMLNSFALGGSRISSSSRLESKEANRKLSIVSTLKSFGINASFDKENIYIAPTSCVKSTDKMVITSFNDHRTLILATLLASLSNNKVIIEDIECINKSYPRFFNDIKKLGIKVKLVD